MPSGKIISFNNNLYNKINDRIALLSDIDGVMLKSKTTCVITPNNGTGNYTTNLTIPFNSTLLYYFITVRYKATLPYSSNDRIVLYNTKFGTSGAAIFEFGMNIGSNPQTTSVCLFHNYGYENTRGQLSYKANQLTNPTLWAYIRSDDNPVTWTINILSYYIA